MKTYSKALHFAAIAAIICLFLTPATGLAQDVTLSWDASTSDDVAGYKLYYDTDADMDMQGWEAYEGTSPIDVGNITTFELTGLTEGYVYYFRATAYNSAGLESAMSNLIASDWIPAPLSPIGGAAIAGSWAEMTWSPPPADKNLTFILLYGTDPNLPLKSTATFTGVKPPEPPYFSLLAVFGCLMALALRQMLSSKSNNRLACGAVALGLALSLTGCGGGGGGGDSLASKETSPESDTVLVRDLTDSSYIADDLEEGETYYWQVVAVDEYGQEYQSETASFRIE